MTSGIMHLNKLLVATHNPGKFKIIKDKLSSLNIEILSLDDLGIKEDFEEEIKREKREWKKRQKKINYVNHFPHYLYLKGKEKLEWANSFDRKVSLVLEFFLGRWLRKRDKELLKENKLLFVNSVFTKKKIDEIYQVNSIVSYPPIDPRIKPVKSNLQEKFIFSCGRIIPDKKYEWLIESCSKMKNKLPLYLAGQGDKNYIGSLKNLAKKYNVRLKFLGKLDTMKIIKYYSSAEVFAFSTPGEDFGLVPAESLTCGTPCVVWEDSSGPTEQIVEGINGFLAKPYDLQSFANKLDLVLDNKFKEKTIGLTYKYIPDYLLAISNIIDSYKDREQFLDYLLENREIIYNIFQYFLYFFLSI